MPETPEETYERGRLAGEINTRLAGHDLHFAQLNGSLKDVAGEMHNLALAVQHLSDQFTANEQKVIATAAALEAQNKTRREATDERLKPLTVVVMIFAVVSALLNLYQFLVHKP